MTSEHRDMADKAAAWDAIAAKNAVITRLQEALAAAGARIAETRKKALEEAAALVERCLGDGDSPEGEIAADVFNDLYKKPMAVRLEAVGQHIAAAIRSIAEEVRK